MEGQPGAAAAVLNNIKRGWSSNPTPVAVTRNQDAIYRAVGRAGIALIGEGNPNRVRPMLAAEKRRWPAWSATCRCTTSSWATAG